MPISTATKALLCLCPPAVMAGTVASVPAAKRAVHHWTAPRHAPTRHAAAHAASPAPAVKRVDCAPAAPTALREVPIVTYAAPIPDEPGGSESTPGRVALGGQGALAAVGGVAPIGSGTTPPPAVVTAVPEPTTWLLLIGGMGVVGMALRRRRGRLVAGPRAGAGAVLWMGSTALEAGEVAATAAVRSTVAAKTTAAGIAGKALMCVCPAAVVAGSVMTVPPLRRAVHASTAMPALPIANAASPIPVPCDPPTVPVAAAPLAGFPSMVTTVPAAPDIQSQAAGAGAS